MEPMLLDISAGSSNTSETEVHNLPALPMDETESPVPLRNNEISPTDAELGEETTSPVISQTAMDLDGSSPAPNSGTNYSSVPAVYLSNGPPTQGLFDALRQQQNHTPTPSASAPNANNTTMGASTVGSPAAEPLNVNPWVTIYGYPPEAASSMYQYFARLGTILDKMLPAPNGNWMHLRYASWAGCARALNHNGAIFDKGTMIGVVPYTKRSNIGRKIGSPSAISRHLDNESPRPTAPSQSRTNAQMGANGPSRGSRMVNYAINLFFGW